MQRKRKQPASRIFIVLTLWISGTFTFFAHAEAKIHEYDPKAYVLCKNRKLVRTVRVDRDPTSKDWVTFYTKAGVDREVGRGKQLTTPKNVLNNIKGNLVDAGWKCRDIKDSTIITAQE